MKHAILQIKGITGESSKEKNGIDVLSFHWSLKQSATLHSQEGGTSGHVDVDDLSFSKLTDKATPTLMKFCATGKHIDEAVLTLYKSTGGAPMPYLKLTMSPVVIESVSIGEEAPNDQMGESCRLNFGKFKVEYIVQSEKGAGGASVEAGFDIAKQKEA